jgi:hypothetical protein
LGEIWKEFGFGIFGEEFQRRGVHVSTPKIGSRGALLCFGGILGNHADLRRELFWRNSDLLFFEVLAVVPRERVEEGDQCVFSCAVWGNLDVVNWGGYSLWWEWGDLLSKNNRHWRGGYLRTIVTGEGFD